jgi:FkbM family methyltransferase
MIDVGAHFGTTAGYFHQLGWTVHCFEPDPANREKLIARFGEAPNITIDPRAVSDKPAKGLSFFASEESTGISTLHAFRDTHREVARVDVTTVSEIVAERNLTRVDFLKIDVEGFDFSVLKGVPWDKLAPAVIECEFEDAKTIKLGHTWRDIADFLCEKGYAVYISEWHPIIRYGVAHDWRRLVPYPGVEIDKNAWGNLLAFKEDPGYAALRETFRRLVKTKGGAANVNEREGATSVQEISAAQKKPKIQETFDNGPRRTERSVNGASHTPNAPRRAEDRNKRVAALTARVNRVEARLDEILSMLKHPVD